MLLLIVLCVEFCLLNSSPGHRKENATMYNCLSYTLCNKKKGK